MNSMTAKFDPFVHEHHLLNTLLDATGDLLAARRATRRQIMAALDDLAEHLQSHFGHEEQQEGFFEVIIEQAPRLSEQADALAKEHLELLRSLEGLRWHAAQGVPSLRWWDELSDRYGDFLRRFLRHEQREHELMQEAFYQDIGAED